MSTSEYQYANIAEANTYLTRKLHTYPWDSATNDQRNKALCEATTRIDRLRFRSSKCSDSQVLEFPRTAWDPTPDAIKWACVELAVSLLDDVDPDLEVENLDVSSEGVSSARATYARQNVAEHLAAGIPNALAWKFLMPYLARRRRLTLSRVS